MLLRIAFFKKNSAVKIKINAAKMLFSILLAIIGLYFLRYYYDYIRAFLLSLKIDGPPALPIIGNGLLFVNKTPAGLYIYKIEVLQLFFEKNQFDH